MQDDIELFRWWLPPTASRRHPYLSSDHMTRAQAALAGALRADTSSRLIVRPVADKGRLGAAPALGRPAAQLPGIDGGAVLLYVYRLRRRGERQSRADMAMEGLRGDLILEPFQAGWRGRPLLLAYLFAADDAGMELLPRLEGARVARLREALTIIGMEAVPRGRKNVERYRQTWVCTAAPVPVDRWPDRPRMRSSCIAAFDPADDDHA